MKRRVSFLLMLILAVALVFALSSCGDCEHEETKTVKEITTEGNCMTDEKYDEVVYCVECEAEISRTAKKGERGTHIENDPVYENVDVLDCTKGGIADKVVYCSVPRCRIELSREVGVAVEASQSHSLVTKKVYNEAHTHSYTLSYCENCAYQTVGALQADKIDATHVYNKNNTIPKNGGVCTLCFSVLGDSDRLEYEQNFDGTWTVVGVADGKTLGTYLYIGYHNGRPVTKIAPNAFENNSNIQYVVMGDSVKEIGESAFSGCKLKKVFTYDLEAWCNIDFANATANPITAADTFSPNKIDVKDVFAIPAGITNISDYAFVGLKTTAIYIPASVKTVGANAFSGCKSLANLHIEGVDGDVRSFGENAFKNCESIRNVYIDSIASWVKNSFENEEANPIFYAKSFYADNTLVNGVVKQEEVKDKNGDTVKDAEGNVVKKDVIEGGAVVVPEGATHIYPYAFIGLNISSIKLPESVQTIGESAFKGCVWLSSADIGNGVTEIAASAFEGCSRLETVDGGANVLDIGAAAFKGCSSLKEIVLSDKIDEILSETFADCTSLVSVKFSAALEKVCANAFVNCTSLKAINLGETANLNEIEAGAFKNCSSVVSILINDNVTSIGFGAFEGCSSLKSIKLPFIGKSKDSVEDYHFGYIFGATEENRVLVEVEEDGKKVQKLISYVPYSLEEVEITLSTVIGKYAFAGCEGISIIKLPASVTRIDEYAFDECTSLSKVYYPDLTKWCGIEFANYSANPLAYANMLYINGELVTELIIPAGITEILPYTFYGAAEIVEIVIPEGVEKIGKDAFAHCTSLSVISLPASLKNIGARAFVGSDNLETVKIADIASWTNVSFGDALANPLYYANALYVADTSVTDITVATNVNAYAFINCDFLTSVTFSAGVTAIGDYAFYNCNKLSALVLPASVTKLGNSAFEACYSIATADFGSVSEIGARAFADCVALEAVALNGATVVAKEAFSGCTAVTEVAFGASLESIGISAFYGCKKLATVNVPASVSSIGAHAFAGCQALTSVTFGAVTGWTVKGSAVGGLEDAAVAAEKVQTLASEEWTHA